MTQQQPVTAGRCLKPRRAGVDRTLLLILSLLMMCGLLALFSATYYKAVDQGDALLEVKRQLVGIGLGAVLMLITSRIPHTFWADPRVVVAGLAASMILLVLVLIPGVGVYLNGSRRWLSIAGMSFQPSEVAKIASVIYLAATLSYRLERLEKLWRGVVPLLIVPAVMFLLILEQPNLSTAGSIMIVAVLMMLLAGARWRHLCLMGVAGLCVGTVYAWIEPYRRERLLSFRDPFAQMSDEGYQLAQSLIAIGSGGLFGRGLGQGRQKFSYLPYPESDFIFAIVGEDFGLLGVCGGDRAVFGLRLRRHAHRGFLPGSPRLSAGGGADGHDCRTGVHQHRRGGGRAAYHGAAASVLQRRRHLHLPADGGDGHHFECIAYVAQIRLFFTLGQA